MQYAAGYICKKALGKKIESKHDYTKKKWYCALWSWLKMKIAPVTILKNGL